MRYLVPRSLPSRLFCLIAPVLVLLVATRGLTADSPRPAHPQAAESQQPGTQQPGTQRAGQPQEPQVVAASDEGLRAIERFQVADGLQVKLFAAEPLVANPVAFCFDELGRMFVAETFRQEKGVEDNRNHMNWLDDEIAAQTVAERLEVFRKYLGDDVNKYTQQDDRIRLVWDANGDGVADQATVFANGFNEIADGTGAGLLAHAGNLYYTCIPKLWVLRDDDHDNVAEVRAALQDGYGVHVAFRGHDMHGLTLGPDGRLYFSIGDRGFNVQTPEGRVAQPHTGGVLRCNLDGSGLEIFAHGLRNPQELAFDDYGNLFTGDNNSDSGDRARWVYVMPGGDCGWRMSFQYFNDRGPWNREKLWDPPFPGQAANIVPPIANFGDGPSGLTYYPGTGFSDAYLNTFFLCDFRGASGSSGVRTIQVQPQGAGFTIANDDRLIWRILATDVDFGPGGAYVSDWVDGWTGVGKGRIYKLESTDPAQQQLAAEVDVLLARNFNEVSLDDLRSLLAHADRRVRQKSQYAIAGRDPQEAAQVLATAAKDGAAPVASTTPRLFTLGRLHATWALGQLARRPEAAPLRGWISQQLLALLGDLELEVRANTARTLADCAAALRQTLTAAETAEVARTLTAGLTDESARVQSLAAAALGRFGTSQAIEPLLGLLNRNADADPFLRHAAVMGLVQLNAADDLAKLAADSSGKLSVSQRRGLLLALRRMQDPRVSLFLRDADPEIVTDAARAINDEPIDAAQSELARLVTQPGLPEPAIRRALNANLRLRTPAAAAVVARFAGNPQAAPEMRREAIDILRIWPREPQRDRVIGLWRDQLFDTLPTREEVAEQVRPELAAMLAGDQDVRGATTRLISALRIGSAGDLLHGLFQDESQDPETRAAALSGLFSLDDPRAAQSLEKAFADKSPVVRSSALRDAAASAPQVALARLPQALQSESLNEKQTALAALGTLPAPEATELLVKWTQQLAEGNVAPELKLDVFLAAQAKANAAPELDKLLAGYQSARDGNDPLAPFLDTLAGGDAAHGEDLFFNRLELSCQRCHAIGGRGGAIGPDLSKIAEKRDRRYLLEALATPNKHIAEGFETLVIETVDGRVLSGILKEETDDRVRLQTPEGNMLEVLKSQIEVRERGLSAMPDDVSKKMSLAEMRDLLEFLAGRK